MTYLALIDRFWELDAKRPFSPVETRLYLMLLATARQCRWGDAMAFTKEELAARMDVAPTTFLRARQRLLDDGLIRCENDQLGRAAKTSYVIVDASKKGIKMKPFPPQKGYQNEPLSDKKGIKMKPFPHIDIDSSYRTNKLVVEKDYYVEEKKGEANFSNLELARPVPIEDAVEALKGERIWGESVCMKFRLSQESLPALLDEYKLHCITIGETGKSVKEAKRHFTNWIRKRQNEQTERQKDETKRQDRLSKRRGTAPSHLRPEDYTDTL